MIATNERRILDQSNSNLCDQWQGLIEGKWTQEINVRNFIHKNYTPYVGDESFLVPATERTQTLWNLVRDLMKVEREKSILDVDTKIPSNIISHSPGYIDQSLEKIVGLQTDQP